VSQKPILRLGLNRVGWLYQRINPYKSQNQTWQVKPKPARSKSKSKPDLGCDFDLAGFLFNLPGLGQSQNQNPILVVTLTWQVFFSTGLGQSQNQNPILVVTLTWQVFFSTCQV
ncbi:MAG: hypothetical protein ABFS56_27525, partial [Pseudomonadota bacterium]